MPRARQLGNALPLRNIPVGTLVHNVELDPGRGGKLARSAGTSAQVIKVGARARARAHRWSRPRA